MGVVARYAFGMKNRIAVITVCALAACLGIVFTLRAESDTGAAASAKTTGWTHLALPRDSGLSLSDAEFASQINGLGAEGWELVTVLNFATNGTTSKTVYYFKKPL